MNFPKRAVSSALNKQRLLLLTLTSSILTAVLPASAAGDTVTTATQGGLTAVTFETSYGTMQCNLPADMSAGDTISGTVFLEPKGSGQSTRKHNEDNLNDYVIEIAGQQAPVRLGEFTLTIPQGSGSMGVMLKNKRGVSCASTGLNIPSTAPAGDPAETCRLPHLVESNRALRCLGQFNGDFGNTSVRLGARDLTKLAESPRCLIAQCPQGVAGQQPLEIIEGDRSAATRLCVVTVSVTLGQNSLPRGQSTQASIKVTGLPPDGQPLDLLIENLSPQVVNLEGGDSQTIGLQSRTGAFEISRQVKSQKCGVFSIRAGLKGNFQEQPVSWQSGNGLSGNQASPTAASEAIR